MNGTHKIDVFTMWFAAVITARRSETEEEVEKVAATVRSSYCEMAKLVIDLYLTVMCIYNLVQ